MAKMDRLSSLVLNSWLNFETDQKYGQNLVDIKSMLSLSYFNQYSAIESSEFPTIIYSLVATTLIFHESGTDNKSESLFP